MKTKSKISTTRLVWACAWCGLDTYKPLNKGEEYTHGICLYHKAKLLAKALKGAGVKGVRV